MSRSDQQYMLLALAQARKAAGEGEVPVGAVCVMNGEVISAAYNTRESTGSALAHAETAAIALACRRLGGWQLWQCELYVTLEPCPMCAGAIVNARIKRVVCGTRDPASEKLGGNSVSRIPGGKKIPVEFGMLENECSAVLREFFSGVREKEPYIPRLTERVHIGEQIDWNKSHTFTQVCCPVVTDGRSALFRQTDGVFSFPRVELYNESPKQAIERSFGMLRDRGKLLTVTECRGEKVIDRIYRLCELTGDVPPGYVFTDKPVGLDNADSIAFERIIGL